LSMLPLGSWRCQVSAVISSSLSVWHVSAAADYGGLALLSWFTEGSVLVYLMLIILDLWYMCNWPEIVQCFFRPLCS
jgi:hypothetical protein